MLIVRQNDVRNIKVQSDMEKNRLEAFSDGVIAIILTIMVLDLKVPKEHTLGSLALAWPIFGAYALSYWNVFLIWLNHHNIFSSLETIDGRILVANGLLLFVVSFIPFATSFASETHWLETFPVVLYGLLMALVSLAFVNLRHAASQGSNTPSKAAHHLAEMRVSQVLALTFVAGAIAAWSAPRWALILYALVPLVRRLHQRIAPTAS